MKILMKKGLLLVITALMICEVSAQSAATGPRKNARVFGIVQDSSSHKAVEFATVALMDPSTKRPVNGAICDEKGKFLIDNVPKGNYEIQVSFMGYNSQTFPLTVTDKKSEIDLGQIKLGVSVKLLQEVVVQGQKIIMEEKVDRSVYHAENDLTAKGGDATDVLKRVPLLSVDMDGNVSLRGSSNVRVLVNNKPSTITASSVADALKQIPADMIKTVEVITSPSSKYDAEGSAGIINIVLKKNNLEGKFLNVDGTAGSRGSNLGVTASYRSGKMGFSLGSFSRPTYNVVGSFNNRQTTRYNGDTLLNIQSARTASNGFNGQYTFGWDYDIDKNNSLTASVRYGQRNQFGYQNDLSTQTFRHDSLLSQSLKNVKTNSASANIDASLTYSHLFKKKDRELDFMGIISRSDQNSGFLTNTLSPSDQSVQASTKNENKGYTQEYTLQVDYQEPFLKKHLLELGGKDAIRQVSSQYQYYNGNDVTGSYTLNSSLTNGFSYNQNISAGYLAMTLNLPSNYTAKIGGRYEYTRIDAHFQGKSNIQIPSYGVLVPSINLSRKLSNGNLLKISYNRRIQRPGFQSLNPNLQASNPLNATQGNPYLKPEYADNYEIAYKTFYKATTINMSSFIRYNTNDIQPARSLRHDTIVAIYQNIGAEINYGMSFFVSTTMGKKLSLNGGIDPYYRVLTNTSSNAFINSRNEGITIDYRVSGNYNFNKGWAFQFFAFFPGRRLNLQGYSTSFFSQSIAVRKEVVKNKISMGFGLDNYATPSYTVHSELSSAYILQSTHNTLHNFIVKFSFSYKIGKLNPEKPKKELNTDEGN